jgi:hypothetical protein
MTNTELREIEARLEATSVIPLACSSNKADLVFINHAKRDIRALLDAIQDERDEARVAEERASL